MFDIKLFKNPTAEFRGAPFWAWNCKLDRDQILRQIDYFKEMGFGGFHMHSRVGMATEYLGEEFMDCVKAATEKAKAESMRSYIYDEDKWASGFAGGFVTKEKKFRKKGLLLTKNLIKALYDKEEAFSLGKPYFLAAFDILLDSNGYLVSYKKISETSSAKNEKWYAYIVTAEDDAWFNDQAYPDTMDKETVAKFIDITYEAYKDAVGDEFGSTVPSIFTDEPNFMWSKNHLKECALDGKDQYLPWSRFFEEKYKEHYGEDIPEFLPELVWIKKDRSDSIHKYRFYDFCAELFSENFIHQCGDWCEKNGIALTGHILYEDSLSMQAAATGESMRHYRSFTIPGIDTLCDDLQLSTAKQCQSVVHQMGKKGMLSELYGVTNWDFDFKGHKFQGDWEAALGVTLRVPHLSWMSMAGEAKRDYPASIFYQSPWYKKYSYIEDHFARLNTVLTRGRPIVKIGVIHPIESYWMNCGPNDQTSESRISLDRDFKSLTEWLISAHHDFNYISEALIPKLQNGNKIGEMEYDTIILPNLKTLRSTTLSFLKSFKGRVLILGSSPAFLDGKKAEITLVGEKITFSKSALISALERDKTVDIKLQNGLPADRFLYQMREDGNDRWLFIARFSKGSDAVPTERTSIEEDPVGDKLEITLNGEYFPQIFDTLSGEILEAEYNHQNGKTIIKKELFESDSLLLRLQKDKKASKVSKNDSEIICETKFSGRFDYTLHEENVLLLDRAEYSLDGEVFVGPEEILRLDNKIRDRLGYPRRRAKLAQPWVAPDDEAKHTVSLRFTINSDIDLSEVCLALEDAEKTEIFLNSEKISKDILGWYVDESIKKIPLRGIHKGENTLIINYPFSLRANLESVYILGHFGVEVAGTDLKIVSPKAKIGFSSITSQSLPFYGGNITYHLPIIVPENCDLSVHLGKYKGTLCEVDLDGSNCKITAFSPYNADFKKVSAGEHTLNITVYGNRFNTFGALHNFAENFKWHGPDAWRTVGDYWGYEYNLKDIGLITSPTVKFYK